MANTPGLSIEISAVQRGVLISLQHVQPDPANYRAHPDDQVERLKKSLTQFGQVRDIVVRIDPTLGLYTVVAGHGVVLAARALDWEQISATIVPSNWSDAKVRAYLVADNELARGAEDDPVQLADLLQEQLSLGQDIEALGWSEGELDKLLAELRGPDRDVDDPGGGGDDFDTGSAPTRVRRGDQWALGDHRLLCGDSTSAEDVACLVGADSGRIRLVWTDPPYGVGYVGGTQDVRSPKYRNGKAVGGDTFTPAQTQSVVSAALSLAASHAHPGCVAYVAAPSGDNLPSFIAAMGEGGFVFHHGLVWVKDSFVFGRTDYHYQHEMILYGWREGAHYWAGDRSLGSVFEIPRPKRSDEHPTMKPIALVAAMVVNSSEAHDVVYDPFAGSGSTLIAAHRLGRVCLCMEIEPQSCDVILARWEAETEGEASLLERDGEAVA